ncbi:MAG: PQQ-binding-like beta-propeller repeat protein [Kiritimatiellae bacterium]|nr:PQQ-binding-like beta-propeller repeat protein [Kiritimatiellia bacterium]
MIHPAVVPVLVGPLQALLALLPVLLVALANALLALFRPRTMLKLLRLLWAQKVPLAVVAALVVAGRVGLSAVLRTRGGRASDLSPAMEFPAFRGGPARRGWTGAGDDPTSGGRNWQYAPAGARTFYASPAVVGGYVYAVSADVTPFNRTGTGRIVCLNAATGECVWRDRVNGLRATFASPAVCGAYLVSGEGLHITENARIICLDSRTGATRWEYSTSDHVESSPCIYDGKVYVGAGDEGGIYCFALEPGPDGRPALIWHKDGPAYRDAESSPVAHDGRLYMGLGQGAKAVVCLEADTGAELWRIATPYPVFGSPAVVDGVLYVGMGTGNFVQDADKLWAEEQKKLARQNADAATFERRRRELAPAGLVIAVDLDTRRQIWEYRLPATVLGAPAVTDAHVFFGCLDGYVYCLSRSGRLVNRWNARAPVRTSPAAAGRHVYAVSGAGVLYALETKTLRPVWEIALFRSAPSATDLFLSSPTVSDGRVYVGSPADGLLCLGRPGTGPEPAWSGRNGGPGRCGLADESALADRMRFAWTWPPAQADATDGTGPPAVTGPLALLRGSLYLPCRRATERGVACMRLAGEAGAGPELAWFAASRYPVQTSPVARGSCVLFADGDVGSPGRRLYAVDSRSGAARWSVPIEPGGSGELLLAGDGLLIADAGQGVSKRSLADEAGRSRGAVLWEFRGGRVVGSPDCRDDRVALALAGPDGVAVLDAETGLPLWRQALAAEPTAGPVFLADGLVVPTGAGLVALALRDGAVRWTRPEPGPVRAPLVLDGHALAALNTEGTLFLMDCRDGRERRRLAPVQVSPILSGTDVVYAGRAGLVRTSVEPGQNGRAVDWLTFEEGWGTLRQEPIVARSRLYFATTRGLVCARPAEGE